MAEAPIACGICSSQQSSPPAVIWCLDCTEGICSVCREPHDLFKFTRSHRVIPIEDYQQLPRDILQLTDICPKHNDKYVMYCQNHLQPCCRICSLQNHKQCKDITKLEDVIQNYKSSLALQDIENTLKECLENIKTIKEDRNSNLLSIEAESSKALDEVEKYRLKINHHLDKLQDGIKAELKQKGDQSKKAINDTLTSVAKEETFINEQIQTVSKIKEYATDFQAFSYSSRLEEQVQTTENRILKLSKDESCSLSKLIFKLEKSIERFDDQFTCFGSIDISTSPSLVVLSKKKEVGAQLSTRRPFTKQIEDINLAVDITLDNDSSNCRGCCILSDGRLAFTDHNQKVITIFNTNGRKEVSIETPGYPNDVKQVNETTLAVSCIGEFGVGCGIHLIDVITKQVTKSLLKDHWISGITVRDENHLLYCEHDIGVRMIHISDETVKDIVKENLPYNCYVTSSGDSVIHTNSKTNTVACHDINGKKKWIFKDESIFCQPFGVTTDNCGNVYVAGCGLGHIIILSADGQKHKEIKCETSEPNNLYFVKAKDTLLVTSWYKRNTVILNKIE